MDFESVLEKSNQIPIVIDFWAPWCGPCKFLGPVIEQLAQQADGKWELQKINSDEHQDIARDYNVRGIPSVKMIFKKEVIAEFTGALPKHQIEKWLEDHLPDERKDELSKILEANNLESLTAFVEANSDFVAGRVALARQLAISSPIQALELMGEIKVSSPHYYLVPLLKDLKYLMEFEGAGDKALDDKLRKISDLLENHNTSEALSLLIETVISNKNYGDDLPRKSVVAIFSILGPQDPLTRKFRKKFDMALY